VPVQRHQDQLHRAWFTGAEPYVESFGGRVRDELLAGQAFSTLLQGRVLVQNCRIEDNTVRPHSALGYRTPAQYARTWTTNQPALS
jgi:putative transposase